MPRLIAIALPCGPRFVHELELAWGDGDAVFPIDPRLPDTAVKRLIKAMRPSIFVDHEGRKNRPDGSAVADGDALIIATSGTTGEPKGAVLTTSAIEASALATSAALKVDPKKDHWLACLPVAHIGGLSVISRAMVTNTPVEAIESPDPELIAEALDEGVNLTALVPAALDRVDPKSFRKILLGGSAIPTVRPRNTVATYGLTETGSGVVYDGKPLAGVEIEIVKDRIRVRGPMLCRGYRDGSPSLDEDGWLDTGDIGSFDDGILEVFGRADDTIISGGEKVYPVTVERLLRAHPDISEVVVVGRPDDTWGEAVTAVIELRENATAPSLDDLRELVKTDLPAYAAPHSVELTAGFERTSLGKVRRGNVS